MKEKIDERIKNIPDKIYLQVGDNVGWEVDFKELESTGEVTWCSDKIENWDIEYIRASEFEHLVNQEAERRIAEMQLTDETISHEATDRYKDKVTGYRRSDLWTAFKKGAKWYRSRLTNDSQKTEGGTK